MQFPDLGVVAHFDLGIHRHFVDDDLAGSHFRAAHEDRHLVGKARQEQALLARAVAAADHRHVLAFVKRPIARRAEVNARADQVVFARHTQAAILRAGGDQDRPRAIFIAIGRRHVLRFFLVAQAPDLLRLQQFDVEAPRLLRQPIGKFAAVDTVGEAREVIEPLGHTRLPAEAALLDHQHVEAFARRVQGRRQAGRPAADADQIVVAHARVGLQSQLRGQLGVAGLDQYTVVVVKEDGRDDTLALVDHLDQRQAGGILLDVHPLVVHALFAQELLGALAVFAPGCAIDCEIRV